MHTYNAVVESYDSGVSQGMNLVGFRRGLGSHLGLRRTLSLDPEHYAGSTALNNRSACAWSAGVSRTHTAQQARAREIDPRTPITDIVKLPTFRYSDTQICICRRRDHLDLLTTSIFPPEESIQEAGRITIKSTINTRRHDCNT